MLTDKQKLFAEEYLIDLNAAQAAIRAGYSEKTAYSIGNENLKKPEIQEYIKILIDNKKSELIAKQDEVLQRLTSTLRREDAEHIVVTVKEKKSYIDDNGNRVTEEREIPEVVEVPAKLSDVNKAAELLGKYYVLWTERTKIDGNQNIVIVDDIPEGEKNA